MKSFDKFYVIAPSCNSYRTDGHTNFRDDIDNAAICLSLEIVCIDGQTPNNW